MVTESARANGRVPISIWTMTFPSEFLDEIRARVVMSGAVGRRVKLTRRGREHVGLCPFHNEKTPSFTVSDDKGFFHCFGCGAHGDVISFVTRTEGLSFPEAVERLANEAGLPMPRESPAERADARRRAGLIEVLEAAAAWFETQLAARTGEAARAYLAGRGLRAETVRAFRLGYAPDRRGALREALHAKGMDDEHLAEAGLIKQPEGGGPPRDYFFDRVIFPITDRRGRVIAFGGRAMGESPAKYLNSPETPLFHKGRVLYNLAHARQAAHDTGELIVAEGYMDVIALAQAGFPAAVAPLGTALTEEQIAELWRLTNEPTLCLDGDEAGRRAGYRAALRALPALRPGISLRFAVLPPGEDPDSLVRGQGAAAMRAVLDEARPLSEVLWLMATEGRRLDTPERQAGLIDTLDKQVGMIADEAVRKAYREAINTKVGMAFGYAAWGQARRPGGWSGARAGGHMGGRMGGRAEGRRRWQERERYGARAGRWPAKDGPARGRYGRGFLATGAVGSGLGARQAPGFLRRRQEQVLLAALVNHPAQIAENAEELAHIQLGSPEFSDLCQALVDAAARNPDLDTEALKRHLSDQGYSDLLRGLLHADVYVHGRFARPDGAPEEAHYGVQDVLEGYRRRQAALEAEEAGRHLAEAMTDEALARLEAKQRLILSGEIRLDELDISQEAGPQDPI
jgi:DNA primase